MERRAFLKRAGAGMAATALAAPAIAQTGAPVRWRLAASWPKSLDAMFGAVEAMCQRVAQLTDKKFEIQPFAGGEIVPALQVLDATQNGTIDCCHTLTAFYVGKNPAYAFDSGVAFGLNNRQQNAWMYYGGGLELMRDLFQKSGLRPTPCGNVGVQMGGFYRKEINSVEDLKGLKFRIGGLGGTILAKLGVVPQQIATADIYPSLERGTIDAAEWIGPYDDEKLGLHKVAKFYYAPGWWEGGTQLHLFTNLEKWNSLPPTYKSIVRMACDATNMWMTAKYDAVNPPALKKLVSEGALLRIFPQPVMEASLKAANEVYTEISATNADFKKIWDNIKAFRNLEYEWWQVAEYNYDNFMIRNGVKS